MIYRETTNPPVATGDGMAAAYRAGAELRDMEFMQFHPTVLYVAGSARHLISEAVRGEGAYLRDKDGDRFMLTEDPAPSSPRAMSSPRPSSAPWSAPSIPTFISTCRISPRLACLERFPGIAKVCRDFGLDITRDLIPVRPGAHYMIGGVTVDHDGRTTLPGLWAAGEVTSSGLHGANRLASNSLLEGLVYGSKCGRGAAEAAARMPDTFVVPPLEYRRRAGPVRAARRGRRHQLAAQPDGAAHGHRPRRGRPARGRAPGRLLVPLRLTARLRQPRRLGAAKPADHRPPDDPLGARARGVARRPLPQRFSQRDDEHWLRHVVCPASLPA